MTAVRRAWRLTEGADSRCRCGRGVRGTPAARAENLAAAGPRSSPRRPNRGEQGRVAHVAAGSLRLGDRRRVGSNFGWAEVAARPTTPPLRRRRIERELQQSARPGQRNLRTGGVGVRGQRPVADGVTRHPVGELEDQPVKAVLARQSHRGQVRHVSGRRLADVGRSGSRQPRRGSRLLHGCGVRSACRQSRHDPCGTQHLDRGQPDALGQ